MTDQKQEYAFYEVAKGFLFSIAMIIGSPLRNEGRDIAVIPPLHFLIGFALELYLKAWLAHRGVPEADLRRIYGHDLEKAHSKALEMGLAEVPRLKELIGYIAPHHKNYDFRYLKTIGNDGEPFELTHVSLPETYDCLLRLDDVIDAEVGASASKGLPVGN